MTSTAPSTRPKGAASPPHDHDPASRVQRPVYRRDSSIARDGPHAMRGLVQDDRSTARPLVGHRFSERPVTEGVDITTGHDPRHGGGAVWHARAEPLGGEEPLVASAVIPPEQVPRPHELIEDFGSIRRGSPSPSTDDRNSPSRDRVLPATASAERREPPAQYPDVRPLSPRRIEPMPKSRRQHLAHRRESPDRGLDHSGTQRWNRRNTSPDGAAVGHLSP